MTGTSWPTLRLGWAGMELTRAGFGARAVSRGGWVYAWRCQDDTESIAAVRAAGAGTGPAPPPLAPARQ
jgi:hypothetical protein